MEHLSKNLKKFVTLHEQNIEKLENTFQKAYATLEKSCNDVSKPELALVIGQNIDKTPQQIKKRSKRLTSANNENDEINFKSSTRQTRASKQHANKKNQSKTNSRLHPVQIKQEKYSIEAVVPDEDIPPNYKFPEPISIDRSGTKQNELHSMEIDDLSEKTIGSKLMEESIEVVPIDPKSNVVEIESENEIMPPPCNPAPKSRKLRVNQKKSEKSNNEDTNSSQDRTFNNVIKIETDCDVTKDISSNISVSKSKNKKSKKTKNVPKPIQLKEERNSTLSSKNSTAFTHGSSESESVYEDAMALTSQHTVEKMQELSIAESKTLPKVSLLNDAGVSTISPSNVTLASTAVVHNDARHDIATALVDATFVTNPNSDATFTANVNATKVIDKQFDVTYDVGANSNDRTLRNKTINSNDQRNSQNIMTEDESDEEYVPKRQNKVKNVGKETLKGPLIKHRPMPKSKLKELFNPCIQSPVRKKVEAFENAANHNDNSNSIPQRQTRTKTRANETKENTEQNSLPKPAITSNIGFQAKRLLTPQQESNYTPTIGGLLTKKLPSSTSKVLGLQKALSSNKILLPSSTSNSNKTTPSQSRDNSIERAKLSGLTEEKKKLRQEKQQKAAIIRGIKEKERQERFKKLMEEREEKTRKKLAEKESLQIKSAKDKNLRMVEDINRNLKILEEREQQRKLEKQKQYQKDQAESAKREREMLENLKIQKAKDQLQNQLEQNKINLFKHNLALKKKINDNGYNFGMIETDDSTDDETVVKSKRPPVPDWSKENARFVSIEKQSYLNPDLVDSFFSVQPMTPNLREIFPNIDPRDLKRNSSAIWNTPPRYSQFKKH